MDGLARVVFGRTWCDLRSHAVTCLPFGGGAPRVSQFLDSERADRRECRRCDIRGGRMRLPYMVVGLGLLSGCFLAPGMRMNESAAVSRGRDTTKDDQFDVRPITTDLLRKLAVESIPQRQPDPLAAEASSYKERVAPLDVLFFP